MDILCVVNRTSSQLLRKAVRALHEHSRYLIFVWDSCGRGCGLGRPGGRLVSQGTGANMRAYVCVFEGGEMEERGSFSCGRGAVYREV